MQNFQLTTIILWGALHSEGGPWPPNPNPPGTPGPRPPNRPPPQPQPLAPQQPANPILPPPWQLQPWAQNQEPIQLTWTAQHNTPQGLVTSWGGYTTHAITNPQPFQPPPPTQQPPGHPFTGYPQIPPQASLPAQPTFSAQQPTLFGPQQPTTAPPQPGQPSEVPGDSRPNPPLGTATRRASLRLGQ